jgi:ubiquinone/menaquinone biosynthesis C-methylase UbiE
MTIPGNLDRFTGFADVYDAYRPSPPADLVMLLTQLAGVERPELVVDLGSGTGLSTVIWADRASRVIGIEPNADMRRQAELRLPESGAVTYRDAVSSNTGLPDACADIVTCSQSLHWLEPESTFAEAARILRPGGVFAAYDCDWPPTMHWEAEAAYNALMARGTRIERERGIDLGVRRWEKSGHLERMRRSGRFRYVRETLLHHIEPGDAERLVGLAASQGGIAGLLRRGVSEGEIGLDLLRAEAERVLGLEPRSWFWSYRVRIGIK